MFLFFQFTSSLIRVLQNRGRGDIIFCLIFSSFYWPLLSFVAMDLHGTKGPNNCDLTGISQLKMVKLLKYYEFESWFCAFCRLIIFGTHQIMSKSGCRMKGLKESRSNWLKRREAWEFNLCHFMRHRKTVLLATERLHKETGFCTT